MKKSLGVVFALVIAVLLVAVAVVPTVAIIKPPTQDVGGKVLYSGEPDVVIPTLINYQGYLTDSSGNPIDGTVPITFTIYDAATDGSVVWTETQPAVTVNDGLFNVLLGSLNPINASHLTGVRYLGVKVGSDPEMTPRQQIVSVAYALRADEANNANTLDGMDSDAFVAVVGDNMTGTLDVDGDIQASGTITSGTSIVIDGVNDKITADQDLELHTGSGRALRLEDDATSPNIIGGYGGNSVTAGVFGATVGGGGASSATNDVTDEYGTVGGGRNNQAGDDAGTTSDKPYATIGGGDSNTASGRAATVGGGYGNQADLWYCTVGGGYDNRAHGLAATVSGGYLNEALSDWATVGGGDSNTASGSTATVAGGDSNTASGGTATVAGGWNNEASGWLSTIPGGQYNTAAGDFSFAAGRRANIASAHDGTFLFADGNWFDFCSSAENEFAARATGGVRFVSSINATGAPIAGVQLASGGGSWSSISDRNVKDNFAAVDGGALLESLANVPIETWHYIGQDTSIRHIGPVAQDFYAAFGVGEDDKHITTVDADGVALAAIQELYELVQEQAAQIAVLQEEIRALQEDQEHTATEMKVTKQDEQEWR